MFVRHCLHVVLGAMSFWVLASDLHAQPMSNSVSQSVAQSVTQSVTQSVSQSPARSLSQAATVNQEEVLVEWDTSRRPLIHGTPFARQTWQALPARAQGAVDGSHSQDLRELDQTDRQWTVPFSDVTVRRLLQRWSADAGYQLLWDVPRDYPIEVEMTLSGKFRDVVWLVAKSLAETDAPVQVSINTDIRLVRVVRHLNGQAK